MTLAALQKFARRLSPLAAMPLLGAASLSQAADVLYGVNAGQQNFTTAAWVENANPANPVPGGPTTADSAIINSGDGITEFPYVDGAVSVGRFTVAGSAATTGGLEIRSGGTLTTSLNSSHYVGARGPGHLRLLAGSTLNINALMYVGWGDASGRGTGTVTQSGGTYNGSGTAAAITIGQAAASGDIPASVGTYNMNAGTMSLGATLVVGNAGTGTFNMNGGQVDVPSFIQLGNASTGTGTFNMNGGKVSTFNYLQIGRDGSGAFVQTAGEVVATRVTGNPLVIAARANATGSYVISGGSLKVKAEDGVSGVVNGASTGNSHGLLKVIGNSPTINFDGSYLQYAGSTLGYEVGSGISPITVGASATLDGALDVKFTSTPTVGQQFTIMNYGGTLTGTFATFDDLVDSPAGANTVKLSIDYGTGAGSAIKLKVDSIVSAPAIPGDFNADGNVNGTDLAAWKTNYPIAAGATVAKGDADGDADVDGADFLIWQRNFTGAGGVAAVPEPTTFFLMTIVGALAAFRRR